MRIYNFMDFDIGGPKSYKDDYGKFDLQKKIMTLYDDNPLFLTIDSAPKPDRCTITSPTKLKIPEDDRDLDNTSELGPGDIASGLQWNLGNLKKGEEKSIDIIISASSIHEKSEEQLVQGWNKFNEKIQ